MSVLKHSAVNPPDFYAPLVVHFVEVRVPQKVVVDLRQQGFRWHHDESLRPPYLVVFVLLELLPNARDVLQGVEDGNEVGEGLPRTVIGVDYEA